MATSTKLYGLFGEIAIHNGAVILKILFNQDEQIFIERASLL